MKSQETMRKQWSVYIDASARMGIACMRAFVCLFAHVCLCLFACIYLRMCLYMRHILGLGNCEKKLIDSFAPLIILPYRAFIYKVQSIFPNIGNVQIHTHKDHHISKLLNKSLLIYTLLSMTQGQKG